MFQSFTGLFQCKNKIIYLFVLSRSPQEGDMEGLHKLNTLDRKVPNKIIISLIYFY